MNSPQGSGDTFKTCPLCGAVWKIRKAFLDDPDIFIVGYQVHFKELTLGLFLFNHACGGTLSIRAGEFTDLYKGTIFKKRRTGTPKCPGHCLLEKDLAPCPQRCECAFVREIIQVIKNWKKRPVNKGPLQCLQIPY